ncbi:MAG: glutamate--cysteine ligase [Cellvibrionaceae bacterium]|nr:glutamate--cysteine ligase [Cellvibrionaceae bacterium]
MPSITDHLQAIASAPNCASIGNITRGIEKESLRVAPTGTLSQRPHPKALGAALTHPYITTDYSEALMEFITPPGNSIAGLLDTLADLHRLSYQHIGDDVLWINSMPCMLTDDSQIPVAQYGKSNSGRMKTIYRLGLGHRYGRAMQTIAGTHYNFSVADDFWAFLRQRENSPLTLKDYKTQGYFRLIRNFRRYFWLLLYLYGAAPAICRSFVKNRTHQLSQLGEDSHSLYSPYATSLRMGDLGYQSHAQQSLKITYNCLDSYSETLCAAITQTHPDYAHIGLKDTQGNYCQLNDGLLQIENEFYSVIRPKRTTNSGQTALHALNSGGVEYIEVRCLDLNPFEPLGISADQIRFLDIFLLYCLLEDSPLCDDKEAEQLQENQRRMVYDGRHPALSLYHFGKQRKLRSWGKAVIDSCSAIAELLDEDEGDGLYSQALQREARKLDDESRTPAGRIIDALHEQDITFYRWAMNAAQRNRDYFLHRPLSREKQQAYQQIAQQSQDQQRQMEQDDALAFDDFIRSYYEQYQCKKKRALRAC